MQVTAYSLHSCPLQLSATLDAWVLGSD